MRNVRLQLAGAFAFLLLLVTVHGPAKAEMATIGTWTGPICSGTVHDGCIDRNDYVRQQKARAQTPKLRVAAVPVEQRAYYPSASIVSRSTQPIVAANTAPVSIPVTVPVNPTRMSTSGLYYPETSGVGDAEVGTQSTSVPAQSWQNVQLYGSKKTVGAATPEELVASVAPRVQHYFDEAMDDARQPQPVTHMDTQPAMGLPVQVTPTITAPDPYTLSANQVVRVGDHQYDRLALYNLVPPLNTISADGPSAADEERIRQIALLCMQNHVSDYDCKQMQSNYLRTTVPLIAASYDHMEHPQQRYSIDKNGIIVKNQFVYYPQSELALSSYERAQAWADLQAGRAPSGADTDPRIVALWRQYCQANRCASA